MMIESLIDVNVFLKLLKEKKREILFTAHAVSQAKNRNLIGEDEAGIGIFVQDITLGMPHRVVEQSSEKPGERKFKAYYLSSSGGYMCYILTMDGQISLITIYRTSKRLQKNIYKYRKARGYG